MLRAFVAELLKLRSLPLTAAASLGTVVAAALLAMALVLGVEARDPASAVEVVSQSVVFLTAGLMLVGAIPVCHEHAGRQHRISLLAVPSRARFLVAKTAAGLVSVALTAVTALTAGVVAAAAARLWSAKAPATLGDPRDLLGAAAYLMLMGVLAHAVALCLLHLRPTLSALLGAVFVASPLTAAATRHARWLPDRAASQLYLATDTVLTPTTGALVTLAWIVALGSIGIWRLVRM